MFAPSPASHLLLAFEIPIPIGGLRKPNDGVAYNKSRTAMHDCEKLGADEVETGLCDPDAASSHWVRVSPIALLQMRWHSILIKKRARRHISLLRPPRLSLQSRAGKNRLATREAPGVAPRPVGGSSVAAPRCRRAGRGRVAGWVSHFPQVALMLTPY